jgi:phospholipid/cholesterol/gamma-HCH transport system substrate-binding protein
MSESSKNIAIGCVVLVALSLLSWILLFLHPSFGDEGFEFHVRFPVIDKVSVGSRVTYAGRPVGKVLQIELLSQASREAGSANDPIYAYDLLLGIDSSIHVYDCDAIDIGTSGFMGERFISILPKRPAEGKSVRLLSHGETVFAQKQMDTEETFAKLANTVSNLEQITATLNASEGVHNLIASVATMCDNISKSSTALEKLIDEVSSDKSSLGKIVTSDDFYLKTVAILSKVDTLMDDVNQYGPLFHLNKTWQREHRKRIEEERKKANR